MIIILYDCISFWAHPFKVKWSLSNYHSLLTKNINMLYLESNYSFCTSLNKNVKS